MRTKGCRSSAANQGAANNREKSFLYSAENVGCEAAENGHFFLKWSVLIQKPGSGRTCCHGAKQIVQMADDFDLDGIQKLVEELDAC